MWLRTCTCMYRWASCLSFLFWASTLFSSCSLSTSCWGISMSVTGCKTSPRHDNSTYEHRRPWGKTLAMASTTKNRVDLVSEITSCYKRKKTTSQMNVTAGLNRFVYIMSLTEFGLSDVHQHVSIGAVTHWQVIIVTTVIVFNGLFFSAPWNNVIIELTPLQEEQTNITSGKKRWKHVGMIFINHFTEDQTKV